nr:hypothetical protein [Chitinophagaceae bacterium]
MKKLIIIAIVLVSSSQLFAQNNNQKYQSSKEGLSQNDINIKEAKIKPAITENASTSNTETPNKNGGFDGVGVPSNNNPKNIEGTKNADPSVKAVSTDAGKSNATPKIDATTSGGYPAPRK